MVVTKVQLKSKVPSLFEKRSHEDENIAMDLTESSELGMDSAKNINNFKDTCTYSQITKNIPRFDLIPEESAVKRRSAQKTTFQEGATMDDKIRCRNTKSFHENLVMNKQHARPLRSALKKSRNSMHFMFLTISVVFVIVYIPSIVTTIYIRDAK